MKLSDIFNVFKGLPATDDAELERWITNSCHPRGAANYEDAHVDIIRFWLRAVTKVQWVREYQHGDRDSVDPNFEFRDGQYGTVHFLRAEHTNYPNRLCSLLDEESGDYCQISSVQMRFIYRLNVLRDAGEATQGQEYDAIQSPIGSAPDPFMNLLARMELPIFRAALDEKGFHLEDEAFRMLQNIPQERNSRYEWQAAGELSVIATVTGSMRVPGANDINIEYCDQLC